MKSAVKNYVLDLIFPIRCLNCQQYGSPLCTSCYLQIKIASEQNCPLCENIETPRGKLCPECQKKSSALLDNLVSASYYQDPLKKIIHHFKYKLVRKLSLPLSDIMLQAFQLNNLDLPDLIIPVPLHPLKKRFRGFNQAEELAQYLSEKLAPGLAIPFTQNLQRKRFTLSQKRISSYQERFQNIQGVFTLIKKSEIKGKRILLIDDVSTTGATLFECAKILKNAGAKKVSALVLSRQGLNNN